MKTLYKYQVQTIYHTLYHACAMLWLSMGSGKTICTLLVIAHRIRTGQIKKTIIFAPLRVVYGVWEKEARDWPQTEHLTFAYMVGTPKQRLAGFFSNADIYLCNYENMSWLTDIMLNHPEVQFDMVVYDEVTKMKNSQSVRFKGGNREVEDIHGTSSIIHKSGWRDVIHRFKFRIGLTGSPASNGYVDLFGQYYSVDAGQRLGEFVSHFRDAYTQVGYTGFGYTVNDANKQLIQSKIQDITIKIDALGYLDLPPVRTVDMMVDLPAKARRHYEEIEQDLFTKLDDGTEIELFSATSVSNKCLQISNGSPYVEVGGSWTKLHDAKLDALDEIIEEAGGHPVLCSYLFRSDAERIMKRFEKLKPVNLTEEPGARTPQIIKDWNNGRIKLLVGHAASMGHGVDGLQEAGFIIAWFGVPHSLELYQQMNGRIADRMGQTKSVSIIRIMCNNTLDLAVADSLNNKHNDQETLKMAIDNYRKGKQL